MEIKMKSLQEKKKYVYLHRDEGMGHELIWLER